jgi:hypothetical protein
MFHLISKLACSVAVDWFPFYGDREKVISFHGGIPLGR